MLVVGKSYLVRFLRDAYPFSSGDEVVVTNDGYNRRGMSMGTGGYKSGNLNMDGGMSGFFSYVLEVDFEILNAEVKVPCKGLWKNKNRRA